MEKWCIVYGSFGAGINVIGPFDSSAEALANAEQIKNCEWEVMLLEDPDREYHD